MTEETLFHEALAKPAAERPTFLAKACAGQPELRAAVEALLAAHEAPGSLLDRPPPDLRQTVDHEPVPDRGTASGEGTPAPPVLTDVPYPQVEPGLVIDGRYTLVGKVGAGGMGEVWVGRQTAPVKRQVALKLIKTGMNSKAVLARFEQERQALALMDHPNIARVFDGGLTPTGQPFFAMELVNGQALTKFCDQARLTPKERLELFVPICQAVQHAHQKGIIHRDLKPANILVTLIDGKPVPKVIDFGVAKATGGEPIDESVRTQFGAMIGTLEYMAPEQAGFAGIDVDTRADLYSLGVILYELLTGLRPFDGRRLRQAALPEAVRILKEEEPARPSTRLSTDVALPTLAALRRTEPKRLMAMLRGELDWVVMKCLEKQRDRRYETANALSRDVQRYLADEPVEARPPSAGYRLGKFLKRHRGPVVAASLILAALLAGIAGTTWGLIEAKRQEGIAKEEAAAKELARAAAAKRAKEAQEQKTLAEQERGYAEVITHFVKDDFLALTSVEGQGRFGGEGLTRNATLRELLDRAAEILNQRQQLAPRTEAELCWIIGVSYRGIGEAARALPFLKRSVELHRQVFGPEADETLRAQNSLAVAYDAAGEYQLALRLHQQTLKLAKANLGTDHPYTLSTLGNLVAAYLQVGRLDLAVPLGEEALQLTKTKLGPNHLTTLLTMHNLAGAYQQAGRLDLAVPLSEEALKLTKARFGREHPYTLVSMNNLAEVYGDAGKLDLAMPLGEEALKLTKAKLDPDHPTTLQSMHNLAAAYWAAGKRDLALPLLEETLKLRKAKLGTDHPDTLVSRNNLAVAYGIAGKRDLAVPLGEETLKLTKAKLGPEHPNTLTSMHNLAGAYQQAGRLDLAVPLGEETLKLTKAKLGPEHPTTLYSMHNLAGAYQEVGRLDLALPLYEQALKLRKTRLGLDHPHTLHSMHNLAEAYREAGKLDRAVPLGEETFQLRKAKLGPEHPDTLVSMNNLAVAYHAAGKLALALALFEETLRLCKAKLGPDHPDTLTTMNSLAVAYRDAGKRNLFLPLCEEATKLSKARLGLDHPTTLISTNNLAQAHLSAGRWDLALPLSEQALKLSKARLGPDHLTTLTSMNNLTQAYLYAGKPDLALPLGEQALQRCKAKLGPDHLQTLHSMNYLALGYWSVKQFGKSIPLFEEMLQRNEAKFGRLHRDTLESVLFLGVNYKDAGRFAEAIPLLEEAYRAAKKYPGLPPAAPHLVAAYVKAGENVKLANLLLEELPAARKALPKDSPQLAGLLAQIGLGLLEQKKWVEAEPLIRECLTIREKQQPNDWSTFHTKSVLGGVLLSQKKYADAEPLLLQGYEGMQKQEAKIPPQGKVRLTEAVERLVQLYEATDRKDEAARWRKEREAIAATQKKLEKQP